MRPTARLRELLAGDRIVVALADGEGARGTLIFLKSEAPKAPAGYESIRMVGSSIGSELTTAVMALNALFSKHYPEIEWSSCSGAASTNPIYITKGNIKLAAFVRSNYIDAYGFDKIAESRIRSINSPRGAVNYFFVIPEDKPWKDITEVPKGLTLCPGSPGSAPPMICEAWLNLKCLNRFPGEQLVYI